MSNLALALDETIPVYGLWNPMPKQSGQNTYIITSMPPTASRSLNEVFRTLSKKWKVETSHLSFVTQRLAHPDYIKILSMGKMAVPCILQELERDTDHWFHALTTLTGENPIPRDFNGSIEEAAQIWIRWGQEHYAT